jgi:hypothetical protein
MLSFGREFTLKIMAFVASFVLAFGSIQGFAADAGSNALCDPKLAAGASAQLDRFNAVKGEFVQSNYTPPAGLGQVANTPCMSKELQRISNQFGYAPSKYTTQVTGGLLSAGGPISGLMQKMIGAEFKSINQAASFLPQMLNFQTMASSVMGNLLGSLGLGDAFSSEVCGLMVDMLLKYVQCENPIKLPNLSNLFGSLNNLLPNGCAGSALKSTLMQAGNMQSLKTFNQPITSTNGRMSLGSSSALNASKGLQ